MSNIQYAVLTIAALSLLLGLSLGQIRQQHQRIEQLEFNRFLQSGNSLHIHSCKNRLCRDVHLGDALRASMEAREKALMELKLRDLEGLEQRIESAVRRYNRKLDRWEDEWRGTEEGLIRMGR